MGLPKSKYSKPKHTPGGEFNLDKENYAKVDLHKNYMDNIMLVSASGKPMKREADLIDVWFDSGSMPYAQWHYPFENKELIDDNKSFPADFIAEGVDQTRGWFYTLHAIGTMVFDSVAYKAVVSNGLVLDKKGQKMSKSKGNGVDAFETLSTYGPDATRWYMITNAQPWDNLKFDLDGIVEVQRKFFGTLYNTYSFFALYANIDDFDYSEADVALEERPEIDRWILSKLNSLIKNVDTSFVDKKHILINKQSPNSINFVYRNKNFTLPQAGSYQAQNAVLAIKTCINNFSNISDNNIQMALDSWYWPARMQLMKKDFFYDVAHNRNGIEILVKDIQNIYNRKPLGLLVLKNDKINPELVEIFSESFERLIISTIPSKDILNKEEIINNPLLQKFEFIENLQDALTRVDRLDYSGGKVIFGSHYIAKEVYKFFDFSFDNGII